MFLVRWIDKEPCLDKVWLFATEREAIQFIYEHEYKTQPDTIECIKLCLNLFHQYPFEYGYCFDVEPNFFKLIEISQTKKIFPTMFLIEWINEDHYLNKVWLFETEQDAIQFIYEYTKTHSEPIKVIKECLDSYGRYPISNFENRFNFFKLSEISPTAV